MTKHNKENSLTYVNTFSRITPFHYLKIAPPSSFNYFKNSGSDVMQLASNNFNSVKLF